MSTKKSSVCVKSSLQVGENTGSSGHIPTLAVHVSDDIPLKLVPKCDGEPLPITAPPLIAVYHLVLC